jgi:dihydrolipoamide dehydrogenase
MKYDVIVIGSGPGGYVAAIRASQLGFKVAIIEKESLGGVCLNWGCIPTKSLLKSASVFHYLNHAEDYGFDKIEVSYQFGNVINRSKVVADKMSKGVSLLMKKNKIEVFFGTAKVIPDKMVLLRTEKEEVKLTADHIILATGSRSRELPNIPQDGKKIIGYREALNLPERPKSMVVVGSGAIGVELAYFYSSMGTEVTLVEYLPQIIPSEDADISKQLKKKFNKIGIKILTDTSVESVETSSDGVKLVLKSKKGLETIDTEMVLSAVGTTANIENIGLEEIGVLTDNGKIIVNNHFQTNIPGYYAIGDIIPSVGLAHVASAEGISCVEKIKGLDTELINYNNIPNCIYCSPEIASVGYTEQEALDKGYKIRVGKFPFSASGKATANGMTNGFVKVIFDEKYGEWLGCQMIGDGVTEMIAEVVVARKLETTGFDILKSIHPHPTLSEALLEAVSAAYGEAIHI